jgi:class 3 adenylate cyclase/tetratricopeptide (TPR) repeat protein
MPGPAPGEGEEDPTRPSHASGGLPGGSGRIRARKTVTVLFSDVVGSTSLGERLDPETLRELMARYFDTVQAVLERHGGTAEKYIGDAAMAVFGVPTAHEDDALRGVRAAIEIRGALARLDRESREAWGVGLQARTGIESGEVVAGDPTSGQAFVSGDVVNVAARLEQVAAPGEILIGAGTFRLVRDAVRVEPTDPLRLRGKAEAIAAYRLLEVLPGAQPFIRRLDSPMVGREAELRQLLDAFDRVAQQRSCELVSVLGAAGIGKSRLVRELRQDLPESTRVIEGRCLPYGEGITFWPVSEMVKQAAAIGESDLPAEARRKIVRLLPSEDDEASLIADRVGAALGLGSAQGAIQETFWAIRRLLETLAAEQPVVAVIEDLHWAEPALLELVEYIARFSRGYPILLLGTARPEILEGSPDWGRVGSTVSLASLGSAEGERLIRNLVGQASLPRQVHDRVLDAADGNPLFVEEILRMLIDDGLLQERDGRLSAPEDASIATMPGTVQAIIAARLDRLDAEERALLQRASVVGRVFYWGAVVDLSPEGERGAVGRHLQTLLRKELIRPEASPFAGDDAFRFSHILVRDVAYASIPKRTRADLHERFATWLERTAGDRLPEYQEVVGHHFEQACRNLAGVGPTGEAGERVRSLGRRAAAHLAASGRRSYDRGDVRASSGLLSRAADLLPPPDPARLETLPLLGAALIGAGRLADADAVLKEAMELARAAGDRRVEARALFRWLYVWFHSDPQASIEDAVARAAAALTQLEEGDHLARSEGWTIIGALRFWNGEAAAAEAALERARDHAGRDGDRRPEVEVQLWLVMCLLMGPCPAPVALDRLADIVAKAGLADLTATLQVARARGELEAIQGRFGAARESLSMAMRLTLELGLDHSLQGVLRGSGSIERLAGELEAAERDLREACRLCEEAGDRGHLASVAPMLADVLLAEGDDDGARSFAELGRAVTAEDDVEAQVLWRRVQAKILARDGDAEQARQLAAEAVDLAGRTDYLDLHANALMDRAEILRLTGRPADAPPVVRQALQLFEQKGNIVMAGRANAMLAELA